VQYSEANEPEMQHILRPKRIPNAEWNAAKQLMIKAIKAG